jgi:hypothetical protein
MHNLIHTIWLPHTLKSIKITDLRAEKMNYHLCCVE